MQYQPEAETILDELARFLAEEVRPAIADKALSFRVLIAANACAIVAREIRATDAVDAQELARLSALLDREASVLPSEVRARRALLLELRRALDRRLTEEGAAGAFGRRALPVIRATLADQIRVDNPRFDLADDIDGDR
jgi:hypothetical protein